MADTSAPGEGHLMSLTPKCLPERRVCMIEDVPELTAELVVDGAVPSQPAISPDGRWVAYVVAPVGRWGERCMSALWVAAADGSSPPWKLTAGTAADSHP